MTRKHKPPTAAKKRPAAEPRKPVKAGARNRQLRRPPLARRIARAQAAAREGAERASRARSCAESRPSCRAEARLAQPAEAPVEKKTLGIERRVPVMPEDRQSQLKLLIARGKEQGYLTYAQVNDHLPSEIVDPEQIEDIVNTINDMGIPVYEKAPDTESLLATEPSQPADEEAIEEAAAALAALDAELGRTTDPVRMYMREMGTVELLTREGEIRIAKRIEEGLDAVRSALAHVSGHLRFHSARLRARQGRPGAPGRRDRRLHRSERARCHRAAAESDQDGARRGRREIRRRGGSRGRRGQPRKRRSTPARIRRRPRAASPRSAKCYLHALGAIAKLGARDPKTLKVRKKLADEFMELKLSPRMFDALILNLRTHVAEVRQLEKEIMIIAVRDAGMPRKDFISTFPKNETSARWLAKHIKAGKKYSAPLGEVQG